MEKTKIISYSFLVVAIVLAYFLYDSVFSTIEEVKKIEQTEEKVIKKLIMIREAQIAYQTVNGKYASNWDTLINFIDTGSFYIINRKEKVYAMSYGADSINVQLDTIGTVLVKDSIFSPSKYPNFILADLPKNPGTENGKFDIWADEIDKNGILVDLVEVRDINPVNKERKEDSEIKNKKPLRFGSRTNISVAGNWE